MRYVKIFPAEDHDKMWKELESFKPSYSSVGSSFNVSYNEKNKGYLVVIDVWKVLDDFKEVEGWYKL